MRAGSRGSTGFAVLRREANEGGFFRPIVKEVVERYLDCGNPKCGFALIRKAHVGQTKRRPDPLSRLRRGAAGYVLLPDEGICGVNEYAECQGVAVGEPTAFQGFAVLTGTICFAYSSTTESSDQLVRRTKLAWS